MSPNSMLCINEGEHKSLGGLFCHLMEENTKLITKEQKCMPSYNVIGLVTIQIKGIRKTH